MKGVRHLPLGAYIVGDAAYTLTEKCLTPFSGSQQADPTKDAYILFLSQVRIRIEMAFGLPTTKWQLLKQLYRVSLNDAAYTLSKKVTLYQCKSCEAS